MSEVNNTPESIDDGIPEVNFEVEVSQVQQAPVDTTLSIAGMAADAKATGDAIEAAKAELEEEIASIETDVSGIKDALYPVGSVFISTSSTAPTFGDADWRWQEIVMPTTWGDLEDGSRSYAALASGQTPGNLHFWLRLANAEVSE